MRVSKPPHERRAELIDAARRLFDERGIDATRVSDIVGAVGVAQGVFYYYFQSKDEMVGVVTAQVRDEMERAADELLTADLPFPARLSGIIELFIGLADQFLADDEHRMPLPTLRYDPDDPAGQARALLTLKLLTLVREGAAKDEVTTPCPEESALTLLWGLHALAARELPTRRTIYAVAEQGLGLAKGSLTAYADPAARAARAKKQTREK